MSKQHSIAAIVPCFKTRAHILDVIERIPNEVERIYVVDDACPEKTGSLVLEKCKDSRVTVICNRENQGVGGATITGFLRAMEEGATILVKIDGDGQMPGELIPKLVRPLLEERADYAKGNRFYFPEVLSKMPTVRLIGNSALSFINKISTGYWKIMDPTNGFVAIHARVMQLLPVDKIARRYLFETDMLFRLNTIRAVVIDVPMRTVYGSEVSGIKIRKEFFIFFWKHFRSVWKRIVYNYFVRDFNLASLQLIFSFVLIAAGFSFGMYHWYLSATTLVFASSGTVMLASLPTLLGSQLFLFALNYDIVNEPTVPIHKLV